MNEEHEEKSFEVTYFIAMKLWTIEGRLYGRQNDIVTGRKKEQLERPLNTSWLAHGCFCHLEKGCRSDLIQVLFSRNGSHMVSVTCFLGFTLVRIEKSILGWDKPTVAKNRLPTSIIVNSFIESGKRPLRQVGWNQSLSALCSNRTRITTLLL